MPACEALAARLEAIRSSDRAEWLAGIMARHAAGAVTPAAWRMRNGWEGDSPWGTGATRLLERP